MELKIWLVTNRIKIKDFANELGVTRTHLGEIMSGRRNIGTSLAKLIELKTNAQVKADDLLKGNTYANAGRIHR
jgi:plasmid maintenance system antidote protein VapI